MLRPFVSAAASALFACWGLLGCGGSQDCPPEFPVERGGLCYAEEGDTGLMARPDTGVQEGGAPDAGARDAALDAPADTGPACTPAVEACNGTDDDCDGAIDEDDGLCPCAVVMFGGRAYMFCHGGNARSWAGARDACRAVGYDLAVPESEAEETFIADTVEAMDRGDTWIGVRVNGADQWADPDGDPLTYFDWGSGEPSGSGECVYLRFGASGAAWNDRRCSDTRSRWVCESPAGSGGPTISPGG